MKEEAVKDALAGIAERAAHPHIMARKEKFKVQKKRCG
jgi:hypothetical protein